MTDEEIVRIFRLNAKWCGDDHSSFPQEWIAAAEAIERLTRERDALQADLDVTSGRLEASQLMVTERTRERDEARANADYWSDVALENHSGREVALTRAEAAERERDAFKAVCQRHGFRTWRDDLPKVDVRDLGARGVPVAHE